MPALLPTGAHSLPPLGGGLLTAYRGCWWALATMALIALSWSWLDPQTSTAIGLLRMAKGAALIMVSAMLYRRRQRDPVAAMLALAFLLWTASSSFDFLGLSNVPALIDRVRFMFFALALLLFPDGEWSRRWTVPIAVLIVATFILGVVEALGVMKTAFFLPIAIGCVLASLAMLTSRYRSLGPGIGRQQLKWVVLGLVVGIGLILTARATAALTQGMEMSPVGLIFLEALFQLGIVVVALGFLISLLRFRLYDAEAAISRSAVYAALTVTLVGTFAASEALIELIGQRLFGMAIGNVSGAVAAAIAAMMLTPLHGWISSWAEQRFQHDLAILKNELPDLLAVLASGVSLEKLAANVLPRIEDAVHSTRMALLVDGKLVGAQGIVAASARRLLREWTPADGDARIIRSDGAPFPLQVALRCPLGRPRAWLLLGPRPDGSFYGRDDVDALAAIAPPLQRALLTVAERQAAYRARLRHDRKIRTSLEQLQQRVALLEVSARAAA